MRAERAAGDALAELDAGLVAATVIGGELVYFAM